MSLHRLTDRGWSTEARRSSVRSGAREMMELRCSVVCFGFSRRRRSLEEVSVSASWNEHGGRQNHTEPSQRGQRKPSFRLLEISRQDGPVELVR